MLDALRAALVGRFTGELEPLPQRGVAHAHVRLVGSGLVARVPRWSQVGLDPAANLAHQAEAFRRAVPSGHTPGLADILPPGPGLPMGALLVTEVRGRPPRLAEEMPAIAVALAALHRLPVPAAPARPPLANPADPLRATLETVERQAAHFDHAGLDETARRILRQELAAARADAEQADTARADGTGPLSLIGSDVHPGNFLIDEAGRAWFTDLEKAQYGHPGIDLAHATLYTSTRWDPEVAATLTAADERHFLDAWTAAVPAGLAEAVICDLPRLRRLVALRTLSWMARWRREGDRLSPGMPAPLARHMAAHIADVLSADTLDRLRRAWAAGGC